MLCQPVEKCMKISIFLLLKVNNVTGSRYPGIRAGFGNNDYYYLCRRIFDIYLARLYSLRPTLSLSLSFSPCPSVFLSHSFTHSLRDNIGLLTSWNTISRDRFHRRLGRYWPFYETFRFHADTDIYLRSAAKTDTTF